MEEEEDGVMAMECRRRVEREMDVDGEELDGHGRGEAWREKVEKIRESGMNQNVKDGALICVV